VLDGLAGEAIKPPRRVQHVLESRAVDVERDLVWIARVNGIRFGLEEDEKRVADAERSVGAGEFLCTRQLGVEHAQRTGITRPKGDVVDAEHAHGASISRQSRGINSSRAITSRWICDVPS
jgi:hypothetical protein